jgi:hypothetical protein
MLRRLITVVIAIGLLVGASKAVPPPPLPSDEAKLAKEREIVNAVSLLRGLYEKKLDADTIKSLAPMLKLDSFKVRLMALNLVRQQGAMGLPLRDDVRAMFDALPSDAILFAVVDTLQAMGDDQFPKALQRIVAEPNEDLQRRRTATRALVSMMPIAEKEWHELVTRSLMAQESPFREDCVKCLTYRTESIQHAGELLSLLQRTDESVEVKDAALDVIYHFARHMRWQPGPLNRPLIDECSKLETTPGLEFTSMRLLGFLASEEDSITVHLLERMRPDKARWVYSGAYAGLLTHRRNLSKHIPALRTALLADWSGDRYKKQMPESIVGIIADVGMPARVTIPDIQSLADRGIISVRTCREAIAAINKGSPAN